MSAPTASPRRAKDEPPEVAPPRTPERLPPLPCPRLGQADSSGQRTAEELTTRPRAAGTAVPRRLPPSRRRHTAWHNEYGLSAATAGPAAAQPPPGSISAEDPPPWRPQPRLTVASLSLPGKARKAREQKDSVLRAGGRAGGLCAPWRFGTPRSRARNVLQDRLHHLTTRRRVSPQLSRSPLWCTHTQGRRC